MWATRAAPDSKVGSAAIMGFLPIKELKDFRKTCAHGHTHPFKQLFLRGKSVPADGSSSYSTPSAALEGVRVIARCGWHTSDEESAVCPNTEKSRDLKVQLCLPFSSPQRVSFHEGPGVEISENRPDENKTKAICSEFAVQQGSQCHHLPLAETQRQTEWESFVVDKGRVNQGVP